VICRLGYCAPATLFQTEEPSPQVQRQVGLAVIETVCPDSEKFGGLKLVGWPVQKITGMLVSDPPGGAKPGRSAGMYRTT